MAWSPKNNPPTEDMADLSEGDCEDYAQHHMTLGTSLITRDYLNDDVGIGHYDEDGMPTLEAWYCPASILRVSAQKSNN